MVYQAGDTLYLTNFNTNVTAAISFRTSAAPSQAVALTAPENANFSPDGRWITFSAVSTFPGGQVRRDVFIATPAGTNLVNLTADQDGSLPNEDARFTSDGQIVYKQRYYVSGNTVSRIKEMAVTLPASGDPSRNGAPATLRDDGVHEFSAPGISQSGRYLYYQTGSGANAGVYRYYLSLGTESAVSATPGVESYYPVARDLTTTLYAGWASPSNHNDQIFLWAPLYSGVGISEPFNDANADDSDPAVVDENLIIFSSDRCVISGDVNPATGRAAYKLYLGYLGHSDYWPLNLANINVPVPDLLGANYTRTAGP